MNIFFLYLIDFSISKAKVRVQFAFIGGLLHVSLHMSLNSFCEFHNRDEIKCVLAKFISWTETSVGFT